MLNTEIWPLTAAPKFYSSDRRTDPDPLLLGRIRRIWQEALDSQPFLLDDEIFSLSADTNDPPGEKAFGSFVPYSHYFASRADSEIARQLGLLPLGVTGIVMLDERILLARRVAACATDKGLWEFAPAGGVDAGSLRADGTIDVRLQLLRELKEEIGIAAEQVECLHPAFWMKSAGEVRDLVYFVRLAMDEDQLRDSLPVGVNGEHDSFQLLRPAEAAARLKDHEMAAGCKTLLDRLVMEGASNDALRPTAFSVRGDIKS